MRNRWWLAPLTAGLLFLATAASAEETETAEKSETTETTGTDEAPPPPPPPPDPAAEELKKTIAELQRQLQELQDWKDEQELRALQQSAETEAASEVEETLEDRTYIQGVRSLQMLNPEISVSGDFLFQLALDENDSFYYATDDRSGLPLRAVDVHIQSSLDPFSLFKSALGFAPEGGVSVEEIYIKWTGVIPSVSFYLGRFRQEIGVVNRWHEHDLDQTGYPLVLDELLGEGGMTGDGVGLTWHMGGWWAHANELTLQVADGYNERLFSGEHFSVPTVLAHLKSYYDLNEDTYLELGLSGMFGGNHRRGYEVEDKPGELFDEHWRSTWVAGADLTVFWEPLQQAKYYNVTWRTEFLYADKEIKGGDVERGWGLYSYLQAKVNPAWFVGVRGDLVEPLERERDQYIWQVVPYITFWQSEFVYLRLEGRYGDNFDHGRESRILFQLDFAAGPHKHEKY